MIKSSLSLLLIAALGCLAQARSIDDEVVAAIPSPNQEFNDEFASGRADIQRTNVAPVSVARDTQQAEPSNEASVPIYVSPFARTERATIATAPAPALFESRQESSHAPPNYAPRPSASSSLPSSPDLKTSASYGHHHHGGHHHGYDHGGWLDMGAWTGGKGSFGWYADYPVGGKHHYGYGRKWALKLIQTRDKMALIYWKQVTKSCSKASR